MAEESNEGVSYLMALKRSINPPTPAPGLVPVDAFPPPTPPDIVTDAGDRFKGAEKRRSPRYKCEGSVELREEGCDVRTWATFTDVSVHGCYVEAQATYPAGTLLHLKLEAHGIRVETNGNVRVSYPYLGMGISYVGMSEENLAQLKRLLATVSHPCVIMGPGIASSLPATDPLQGVPLIAKPEAAIQALIEFFESRQMLMRDDFLRILRKSQPLENSGSGSV
jgi:hypothetical protein